MPELQFKSVEPVSNWQWLALCIICVILITILMWFKNSKNTTTSNKKFTYERYHLGTNAIIYNIEIDSVKYYVFESKNGVTQLTSESIEAFENE